MQVGTDITHLKRFEKPDSLAKRILSSREYDMYLASSNKTLFIAGRFASKEAFIKAKNESEVIPYKSIEVLTEPNGRPYIEYKNEVYSLSISHDGEYAVAVVVI